MDDVRDGANSKSEFDNPGSVSKDAAEIIINISDVSDGSDADSDARRSGENRYSVESDVSLNEKCAETSLNIHISSTQHAEGGDSGDSTRELAGDTMETGNESGDERGDERERIEVPKECNATISQEQGISETSEMNETSEVNKTSDIKEEREGGGLGSAQLLEMELRRRALEAELRRTNVEQRRSASKPSGVNTKQCSQEESLGTDEEVARNDVEHVGEFDVEYEDAILVHPEWEGSERDEEEEGMGEYVGVGGSGRGGEGCGISKAGLGEMLEERLRERALQAMLNRRGKTNSKS